MRLKFGNKSKNLPLILILGFGFLIRFVGVIKLLPCNYPGNGMESDIMSRVLHLFLRFPDMDPRQFDWGPLFQYTLLFAFKLYGLFWTKLTAMPLSAFIFSHQADKTSLYFLARMISLLFGIGTIALVYLTSKKIYGDLPALLSALFIAVAPLHIENSHFIQTDIAMVFFSTLALFFCLRIFREQRRSDYIFAGLAIALGTATKYLPVLIFSSLLISHQLIPRSQRSAKNLLICLLSFAAVWFAASPYTLLNFRSIVDINKQFTNADYSIYLAKMPMLLEFLKLGLGWPLAIMSALSLWPAFKRAPKEFVILLSYPLEVIAFILVWKASQPHYFLSVVPILAVFAAQLAKELEKRVRSEGALILLLALLFAWPIEEALLYDKKVIFPTTIEESKTWIDEHIAPGSKVVEFFDTESVPLSEIILSGPGGGIQTFSNFNVQYLRNDKEYPLARLKKAGVQYVVAAPFASPTPSNQKLIRELENGSAIIEEVDADPKIRLGPTIKVYKL